MRHVLLCIVLLIGAFLGGCGGGSFAFAPGAVHSLRLVTDYHPNGQMKDQGYVGTNASGSEVKTGPWQWWFDNGQLQWQGSYRNGAIDSAAAWLEWNRNGSLRDSSADR